MKTGKAMKFFLVFMMMMVVCLSPLRVAGQEFLFGNDLSYVDQMEDCGAVVSRHPPGIFKLLFTGRNLFV